MNFAARALIALAAFSFLSGCQYFAPPKPSRPIVTSDALAPSPRLLVGRIVAVDLEQGFAFVEVVSDAPPASLAADTELIARTLDLQETARLRASRQRRGRTLGTIIVTGNPGAGDEVVWLAP